jgi:hypothetical protein
MHEKSDLYKMVGMVLNAAPPLITKTEELADLLLGRSNVLFITKTAREGKPGEFYANVTGVAPLQPGQVAPKAPEGFTRAKDKPALGQPVQRAAQAAPATAAVPQAAASNNRQF